MTPMLEKVTCTKPPITFTCYQDENCYYFKADFGWKVIQVVWRGNEDKDWFRAWMNFCDEVSGRGF